MAVAEIIGAAIGVLLLVIVAYLLVGGTLSTAETVATAQKDLTLQHETRLRTAITISDKKIEGSAINFSVTNTGNEIVSDFRHMDVYSYAAGDTGYRNYVYDENATGDAGTWTITTFVPDSIHPRQLDPGETMWCMAIFSSATPTWFMTVTSNGVDASAYL
jgi:flagellar protein FlaF